MPSLIYLKLTTVALLWAGTFIAGRVVADLESPATVATARFGLAASILLVLTYWSEKSFPRLTMQQLLIIMLLGITGIFLYNLCFLEALARMPASRTAIFVALNPVTTALLAMLVLKERLCRHQWYGIIIALLGTSIVISNGVPSLNTYASLFTHEGVGERFMLIAVISWAIYTLIGRTILRTISPLTATTYAATSGFFMLLIYTLIGDESSRALFDSPLGISAISYLAIGGTVLPFVWYYQGVQEIGPAKAAVFTNLVPVFGVVLGLIMLSETLTLATLLGMMMTLIGVFITNRQRT